MADHFEKIQKLPEKIDGVPNFRRVPGYKVYCCGQPTIKGFLKTKTCPGFSPGFLTAGFETVLEKVCGSIYPKDGKIIWLNMRQEPIVYVNGNPMCGRPPNKIGEYAELGDVTAEALEEDEKEFLRVVKSRVKNADGKLDYVDVDKKKLSVEAKDVKTLGAVVESLKGKYPGLVHLRIPICNSASPLEADYDTICSALTGSGVSSPVIVNCQVGLSRSTTGCIAACLFREFQLGASFEGLVETVPGVNVGLLRMDRYKMDPNKDALFRGEFEVIKELMSVLPDGEAAKRECDKVVDKNGPKKTGGTGIKQIRENIAESKLSYEIMDDAAQAFLKQKIMDNIQKYFYLIVFTAYTRECVGICKDAASEEDKKNFALAGGKVATPADQLKLPKTFSQFMEDHSELRTLVEEGKGKLQWERDIPADALANLESLAGKDFKGNLGPIIHDIYQTAHGLFSDLPQGDHKKRAKYRFASKTLMRVLPVELKSQVEGLIEKNEMTMDLYEILGQCTWGQNKAPV